MAEEKSKYQEFINYLRSKKEDRGIMAALRRGFGKTPGSEFAMYPYIEKRAKGNDREVYYLVASIFAYYKTDDNTIIEKGNMGNHLYQLRDFDNENDPIEKRFINLLTVEKEDLFNIHLRQIIPLLKSKEIAINWVQLMKDLNQWHHPDKYIQKRWAEQFWT